MKVGVVSSYAYIKKNNNYGALFQYYALQEFLNKRGHDVYWIKTITSNNNILFFLRKFKEIGSIRKFLGWIYAHNGFMNFCKKKLKTSKYEYLGFESINNNPPSADVYITGSDQVWGSEKLKENYLLFAPNEKKRVGFAVSFGRNEIDNQMEEIIKPWVLQMDAVSVREESGIAICNKLGINAIHLLDPSLLINAKQYPSFEKSRFETPYVYCYFLNVQSLASVYWEDILEFCKSRNLKLKVCAVQGSEKLFDKKYLVYPTPIEWQTDYRYASFVFTNTFHGTVFAMIHHRPFATIMQNGVSEKQNCRMESLLKSCGMSDRIIDKNIRIDDLKDEIEWTNFETTKSNHIINTDAFLQSNAL